MKKIVAFMHVSLDGFVAGPNGEMNWIHVDEEIFDFAGKQTAEADTALYGRITYDMMQGYWPTAGDKPNASKHDIEHSRWYNKVSKVVLSRSMKGQDIPLTKIISDDIKKQITELRQQPGKNILIFGSPSATHTLMELDLVDEYRLFINPVLLGKGIPMFKNIKDRQALQLDSVHTFSSGVVGLYYSLKK
jgi:dihydrofolate reductase